MKYLTQFPAICARDVAPLVIIDLCSPNQTKSGTYARTGFPPFSLHQITALIFKNMVSLQLLVEFFFFDWSSLVYFDNGRTEIVVDGLRNANGVNVSPDHK